MKKRVFSALLILLCLVSACSTDPNVTKKRFVDSGNKYFKQDKFKEALIMYRKALKTDLKYGEAYYRSALAELRLQRWVDASRSLQRAVELQPDNLDAHDQITNLYLNVYMADRRRPKQIVDELKTVADKYAKRFPNSYSEPRLRGYLALMGNDAAEAATYFEKANRIKPLQQDLVMVYMQTLVSLNRAPEAEKLGLEMLAKNPGALSVYDVLYVQYAREKRQADAEKIAQQKVANNPKVAEVHLQLAAHYYTVKDRQQMLEALKPLESDPKAFPNALLQTGDFFARIREYDLAAQKYQDGAKRYPTDKNKYQKRLVEILVKQNLKDKAVQLVNDILKDDPKDSEAIAIRASLSLLTGTREQLQSAINDLQTVIARMPENPVLRYNLGRALLARQDFEPARIQLEEAVKLRPDYLQARITLAQMMLQKQEFGKVVQMTQEILVYDPSNLSARLIRSRALIGTGEVSKARDELTQTAKQFPDLPEARLQIAALDLQDKNFKSAEEAFRQVYGKSQDPRAFMGLIDTYIAQGQSPTAIKMLREALVKDPERLEFRMALANISVNARDYSTAVTEYEKVIAKLPRNSQVWLQLSEAYRRSGDTANAMNAVQKAREIAPTNVAAHLQLAMLYDTGGRRPEARPAYEQVLRLQPENAIALNNLAFLMAESGNQLDEALTMAQKAKQQRPNDEDVADTLGWIYIKKNLPDSAVAVFRDLTLKNPQRATFRYHLAMALYQKGDKIQAKKECELALRSNPNADDVSKIKDLISKLG
ncbi:MAG: tetratricopeptide repeat protein [Bryobacteraceae bacterium]|nr:tetratricopeptide repeat protein [Bryobacteraceae bacterium]